MIIGCVAALLGFSQAAVGADPFYDELRVKVHDSAKWTYPDWSEGLPKPPKEETKATIDARAKTADYLSFLERSFVEYERPFADNLIDDLASGSPFLGKKRPHFVFSSNITLAVDLYERTGKKFYLDYAKRVFDKYLEGANKAHEKGESFGEMGRRIGGAGTGTYHYGIMMYMMSKHVKLTDERFKPIREIGVAATKYNPKDGSPMRMYACGNHSTRQFAGAAFMAKAFEKDPEVKWLVDGCDFGWKWYQWKQSVQENDNSYGFYCLNPMLQIARAYGDGIDSFKGQGYQALLERYAYLTTPSGYYPQFGYAFRVQPCLKKVTVAEVAARATDDSACLYFANKLYSRWLRLQKIRGWAPSAGSYETSHCTNLLSMPKTDLRAGPPKVLSKVYRTNEWNLDKESTDKINAGKRNRQIPDRSVIRMGYDKLVLKTSNAPGGAMVMMDLATRRGGGDKSHPETRPSVKYYEAQHVPLWFGTKYSRVSQTNNLLWLTPGDLDFPHMDNCKDDERLAKINPTWNSQTNPQNLQYGEALAQNKGSDAYGFIEFVKYYRPDTSMTRRLLLTQEGILVIRDDLTPGQSVDGYTAGPLWSPNQATSGPHREWHNRDAVKKIPEPAKGENWSDYSAIKGFTGFDKKDNNVYASKLFIYYGKANGRRCGAKRVVKGPCAGWVTTYSCQTVKAGEPVTFLMVLIPHPPEVTGKMLADNLSTNVKDGVATVSLKYKGQTLTMEMGKDNKSWSVVRQ